MTNEELDFIGAMNMCDEISNEAYRKIMCHCEEQQPCEDCISRAEAEALFRNARKELHKLNKKELISDFNTRDLMLLNAEELVHLLPSVQPKAKVGHWNYKQRGKYIDVCCSKCGYVRVEKYAYGYPVNSKEVQASISEYLKRNHLNFCEVCGVKMEGSE